MKFCFPLLAASYSVALGSRLPALEHGLESRGMRGGSCTPETTPPANAICGLQGSVDTTRAIPASSPQMVSLERCRDFCVNRNGPGNLQDNCCNSFSHSAAGGLGECILYQPFLTKKNFQEDPKSNVSFYSIDCFACNRSCATSSRQVNLIDNPGFELSSTLVGPWLTSDQNAVVEPGDNSQNAFFGNHLSQCIGTCPGQDYMLSLDIKPPNRTFLSLDIGDFLSFTEMKASKAWRTLRLSFRPEQIQDLNPLFISTGKPTLFDNAIVEPISPPAAAATTGRNLVPNGGFESGSIQPWTVDSISPHTHATSEIVSPGLGGAGGKFRYSFQGTTRLDAFKDAESFFTLHQNMSAPTERDQLYVVSMDYQLANKKTMVILSVGDGQWNIDTPTIGSIGSISRIFTGSGDVQEISITCSASVKHASKPFVQGVAIDNVSVRKLAQQ